MYQAPQTKFTTPTVVSDYRLVSRGVIVEGGIASSIYQDAFGLLASLLDDIGLRRSESSNFHYFCVEDCAFDYVYLYCEWGT